jgi:ribosomal protein S18 acetylase RimI-like enzyme
MASGAVAPDERELIQRQATSQRSFYRTVASSSAGARLVELDDVQATIVPVRPGFSFFNSVFYEDPRALERALPALALQYARAGVAAWTVWVRPGDADTSRALEAAGHVRDSAPLLMAAPIAVMDLEQGREIRLVDEPSWGDVARCNDRAYGIVEPFSMAAVFEQAEDSASHLYAVGRDGDLLSALLAREHDGDCYLWFVATVPQAQGRGLASALVRHALREASARGCTTTTLESTTAGERVYGRLGYRSFGRYELWERRAA